MIDILIPTYNRRSFLLRNLDVLSEMVLRENLEGKFRIIISDNNSTDETFIALQEKKNDFPFDVCVTRQDENIGLEKNAVFLLNCATSDFIMYLGDDDFLPDGYLTYLLKLVESDLELSAVIPGFSALMPDGSIRAARWEKFGEAQFSPGIRSVLKVSQYGHQLSGILLKRSELYQEYVKVPELRNIYPFIFFLAFNNMRGTTYYAPKFQLLISQGNKKDWAYDDSGLLTEIFRNYRILFPTSPAKEALCCISFLSQQQWRIRAGKNFKAAWQSFTHLMSTRYANNYVKICLPFLYFIFYSRKTVLKLVSLKVNQAKPNA